MKRFTHVGGVLRLPAMLRLGLLLVDSISVVLLLTTLASASSFDTR